VPRKKEKNRKRFWLIFSSALVVLLLAGYGVYQYALNKVAEKMTEEITSDKQLMEEINKEMENIEKLDEKLQEEIAEQQQSGNSSARNNTSSNDSGKNESSHHSNGTEKGDHVSFSSKQEALSFVMSRLSVSEMNRFRQMASDGLTEEEKQELKKAAFSKFSSAEIAAVLKALQ
jgi:hypothetical protein